MFAPWARPRAEKTPRKNPVKVKLKDNSKYSDLLLESESEKLRLILCPAGSWVQNEFSLNKLTIQGYVPGASSPGLYEGTNHSIMSPHKWFHVVRNVCDLWDKSGKKCFMVRCGNSTAHPQVCSSTLDILSQSSTKSASESLQMKLNQTLQGAAHCALLLCSTPTPTLCLTESKSRLSIFPSVLISC